MAIGAGIYLPASPIAIRDGTASRLSTITEFTKVFSGRQLPTKDAQIPFAAVWQGGERTEPVGDANVGEPRFMHTLTIAVDVVTKGPSQVAVDEDIVALVEKVKATLLTDATWVELFEGIEHIDVRYEYPKEAGTLSVQATIDIQVFFRSVWPPYEPNNFNLVVVTDNKLADPTLKTGTLVQEFNLETTS